MKANSRVFVFFLLFTLLLSSCILAGQQAPVYGSVIDYPRQGSIIMAARPITVSMALPADLDVEGFSLTANGRSVGKASGEGTSVNIDWTPDKPGEYTLQAVMDLKGDGTEVSDPVRVCAFDPILFSGGLGMVVDKFFPPSGYTGPCEIPTPDPSAPTGQPVSMTITSDPAASLVYHDPQTSCPTAPTAILSFNAEVHDPSDSVAFIDVFTDMVSSAGESSFIDIVLNQTSTLPNGDKVFSGSTIDLNSELNELTAAPLTVTWSMHAYGRDGAVLVTGEPKALSAIPCGDSPAP